MFSPNKDYTEGCESMTFQNIDSTEGSDRDRVVQSLCTNIPTTSARDKIVQSMPTDITYDIKDRSASLEVTSPLREKSVQSSDNFGKRNRSISPVFPFTFRSRFVLQKLHMAKDIELFLQT